MHRIQCERAFSVGGVRRQFTYEHQNGKEQMNANGRLECHRTT